MAFANEQLACGGEQADRAPSAPRRSQRVLFSAARFLNGCAIILLMSEPKSAYELAMEKLRKKDAESGTETQVLTDDQRTAIAEARSVYESRVAERRIMHQSAMLSVFDSAEREERESQLRRDLDRFASERDGKIRKIREAP